MKKIGVMFSLLFIGLSLILASCGNNNLPTITGELDLVIYKTAIIAKSSFVDTDEHDLYYDNVKVYVTVDSTGEEAKQISRKDVTIVKPTVAEPEEGQETVIDKNMSGNKVEITKLEADTNYIVKLIISAGGSQKTLDQEEITTLSSGDSEEDPILINNLDMFMGMNKELDAYYKLTADIDCGGALSTIFNSSAIFTGTFDGGGHKIYNFKMEANNYTGLFGYMSGATIKDLVIENVSYDATRSDTYLGALAGRAKRCTISNVFVNGVNFTHSGQTSRTAYIGGLIGSAENCTITNCQVNDLSISIPKAQLKIYTGGFVGFNSSSKISNSYVQGKLEATITYTANENGIVYLGGFAGVNDSTLGINSCYSKVNINVKEQETVTSSGYKTHSAFVGGFVGSNIHNGAKYFDCASIGSINVSIRNGYFVYAAGFVANTVADSVARFENCVYVPMGNGFNLELAPKVEDKEIEQTAYWSLATANLTELSQQYVNNMIVYDVYQSTYEVINSHDNTTKTDWVQSQNLDAFSDFVKNAIINN